MSGALKLQDIPLRQISDVKTLLMTNLARDQLAAVAAKHMNPERMMRVVANAIRTTPKLQECDPMSFLGALMHCASLGLEPNTPLGHAYLIPFKNNKKNITEVQVVIGYKGFIEMARRSGQLANIHGDVVYSDDALFSHEYGTDQHIRHRPGPRKGKMIGAYCYVELALGDGITAKGHRYMSVEEIIAHRNTHSQGWKTAVKYGKTADSPWNEANPQFEAMCIKTAIRVMANRGELPMSIEFMTAMETDERAADYRGFAIDPTIGITQPAEDDFIEGESQPQGAGLVDQQSAGPDLNAELQRTERPREPVQREEPRRQQQVQQRAAAPVQQRDPDPRQEQADTGPVDVAEPTEDTVYRQFMADVGQVGVAEAADLWKDDLPSIARRKPDVHAAIMALIDAQQAGDAGPAATAPAQDGPFVTQFLKDVADMGLEGVDSFYARELGEMQNTHPDAYQSLMQRAQAVQNGGAA